jgi:hypothetical protein
MHHPEPARVSRNLICSSCGAVTRISMEGYWIQYEWNCRSCGVKNIWKRGEAPRYYPKGMGENQ